MFCWIEILVDIQVEFTINAFVIFLKLETCKGLTESVSNDGNERISSELMRKYKLLFKMKTDRKSY